MVRPHFQRRKSSRTPSIQFPETLHSSPKAPANGQKVSDAPSSRIFPWVGMARIRWQAPCHRQFAAQINLSMDNCWGIVRCIVDQVMAQKDGKYLIVKDPNKPVIRLYDIPDSTFESDEESDEEEDNNGEYFNV